MAYEDSSFPPCPCCASTASVYLLSRAHHHGQLKQHNEVMQRELLAAQTRVAELEATSTTSQAELVAIRERAALRETDLLASHKKTTKLEADLEETRENTSNLEYELLATHERNALREAELVKTRERVEVKAAHERALQAEERAAIIERDLANGLADTFLEGFDELREKIFAAFPDIDVLGFMPIETEVPDNGDGGSSEAEDEAEVEEE